jgi:hypothetical protein
MSLWRWNYSLKLYWLKPRKFQDVSPGAASSLHSNRRAERRDIHLRSRQLPILPKKVRQGPKRCIASNLATLAVQIEQKVIAHADVPACEFRRTAREAPCRE